MEIEVSGAKILYQNSWFCLTETVVNMWIVMAVITVLCFILGRNLKVRPEGKRQIIAEFIVKWVNNLVNSNMGEQFSNYAPLAAAILSMSALCSLSSLFTLFSPTVDLSCEIGWALLVFILITYYKVKTNGVKGYFAAYFKPIPVLMPINVIGEIATPISMAFRHYGNMASGTIISSLIYASLAVASKALFGLLPGVVGELASKVPLLQVGIPAVLSLYFDLFSSVLQAFIFCMLTMINIKTAAE